MLDGGRVGSLLAGALTFRLALGCFRCLEELREGPFTHARAASRH
jgi:hypothetical protein